MLHSRDLASNEHLVARGFPVPVDQPAVGTILFEGPAFSGPALAAAGRGAGALAG